MISKSAFNNFFLKFANDQPPDLADVIVRVSKKIHKNIERRRDIRRSYGGTIPKKQDTSTFGAIKTLINLKRR